MRSNERNLKEEDDHEKGRRRRRRKSTAHIAVVVNTKIAKHAMPMTEMQYKLKPRYNSATVKKRMKPPTNQWTLSGKNGVLLREESKSR